MPRVPLPMAKLSHIGAFLTPDTTNQYNGTSSHGAARPASVRLEDLGLGDALEREWLPEHIAGLVWSVHQSCWHHLDADAQAAGLTIDYLQPPWAFERTYATWPGLTAILEVRGPRAVATEWLNIFGWLVVDECHRLRAAAGEPGAQPFDLGALQSLEDRWHPELRAGCCGGSAN